MTDDHPGTKVSAGPNWPTARPATADSSTVAWVEQEAFYRAEAKRLVAFVMRCAGTTDWHEAFDAVHNAFAIAIPRWHTIDNQRAWFRRVALREFLRHDAPIPTESLVETAAADQAIHALEQRRQELLVIATLQRLPFKQRQVMAWTFDGFTPAEIAAELDQDPAAVRQNLHKARRNLARYRDERTKDAS